MNFKGNRASEENEFKMDITPLVDIVFLLLIFLLISTTFKTREHAFSIALPTAGNKTSTIKARNNTIYITKKGKTYLLQKNNESEKIANPEIPLSREQLKAKLETLKKAKPNIEIFIKADKEIKFQQLVKILDICSEVKIENIYFPYELKQKLKNFKNPK